MGFGAIAGGVLGAAGSIFGGLAASAAMRKAKEGIEQQKADNKNWYNNRYNEDVTQRADAQRMLTKAEQAIRERNKAAAGAQAVMGGTEESAAATKAANAQTAADATAQIVANGEQRKDNIEKEYREKDAQYQKQLNDLNVQKANAIGQAVKGVASAAGGMMGGM